VAFDPDIVPVAAVPMARFPAAAMVPMRVTFEVTAGPHPASLPHPMTADPDEVRPGSRWNALNARGRRRVVGDNHLRSRRGRSGLFVDNLGRRGRRRRLGVNDRGRGRRRSGLDRPVPFDPDVATAARVPMSGEPHGAGLGNIIPVTVNPNPSPSLAVPGPMPANPGVAWSRRRRYALGYLGGRRIVNDEFAAGTGAANADSDIEVGMRSERERASDSQNS